MKEAKINGLIVTQTLSGAVVPIILRDTKGGLSFFDKQGSVPLFRHFIDWIRGEKRRKKKVFSKIEESFENAFEFNKVFFSNSKLSNFEYTTRSNISAFLLRPSLITRPGKWVEGYSMGLPFVLGMFSLGLSLKIREDLAATGSIAPDGTIKWVEGLEQKLQGIEEFNSGGETLIKTVIIPPPPDSTMRVKEGYKNIIKKYSQEQGFSLSPLRNVRDVFKIDKRKEFKKQLFFKVFDELYFWKFFIENRLWSNEKISESRATLTEHTQEFVEFLEQAQVSMLPRLEELTFLEDYDVEDIIGGFDGVRDLVIQLAEQKETDSLSFLLRILCRKYSNKYLTDFKSDLEIIFKEIYLKKDNRSWKNIFYECKKELEKRESFSPTNVVKEIRDIFNPFISLVSHTIRLVSSFFEFDISLGRECFDNKLFNFLKEEYIEAQKEENIKHLIWLAPITEKIYNLEGSIVEPFDEDGGLKENRPIPLKITVKSNLSELRLTIQQKGFQQIQVPATVKFSSISDNIISNPVLLWQKSYDLPEFWKSNDFNPDKCKLSNHPSGELYDYLFSNYDVEIIHQCKRGETPIRWNLLWGWPPSIDSFYFSKVMEEKGYFDKNLRSVADIGTGTGFLGIILGKYNPNVRRILLSDINSYLIQVANHNVSKNIDSGRVSVEYRIASDIEFLLRESYPKFDLMVCAPPYLPEPEKFTLPGENFSLYTDGTVLFTKVITQGLELAKEILIQFSSLAMVEYEEAMEVLKSQWKRDFKHKILGEWEVPLRIPRIAPYHPGEYKDINSSLYPFLLEKYKRLVQYHDEILIEKRHALFERNFRNFRFWHKIYVSSLALQC